MSLIQYLRDTKNELRHVAWPTRAQTFMFTTFVLGLSLVIALYLGFADLLFSRGVGMIINSETQTQTQETPSITIDTVATGTMPTAPMSESIQ